MLWNRLFWASFALTEAALIILLILDFSYVNITLAFIILLMGPWKLMEDSRQENKAMHKSHKVRRDILNKLKN